MFSSPPALVAAAEIGFGVIKKGFKPIENVREKGDWTKYSSVNSDAEWNIHFSTTTKSLLKIKLEKHI